MKAVASGADEPEIEEYDIILRESKYTIIPKRVASTDASGGQAQDGRAQRSC